MLVHHFLENSADTYPEKDAVLCKDVWTTYGQIESAANRLARYLVSQSIARGDRVALLMENSVEYIVSYFAILKTGAVVVALNNEITPANLHYFLETSGSMALITNNKFAPLFGKCPGPASVKFIVGLGIADAQLNGIPVFPFSDAANKGEASRMQSGVISLDLAALVFTSGSTGEPKGVMLSHQNLCDNTISITQYLHLTSVDRMMVILPFYYIYGNSLLTTHFNCGGSLVIDNRFMFPNVVINAMNTNNVTGFAGVPSTFMILLNKSILKQTKIPSLRYITQAGGAMAPTIQLAVAEAFAPAKLYIMYGTTEASPRLTYLEPEQLIAKLGSIGKAIPNVEVIIADELGNSLPTGQTGEIAARGSNIMVGYWNEPESTAAVIRNGYYYTGDLGKTDTDGFIFVVGRTKDMIKAGGNRVSAKEIEEALLTISGVEETAVIGIPDPILGEAIKAFLVMKEDSSPDETQIKKQLVPLLATYKIPKFLEFVRKLPKNESGKMMKEQLKDQSNTKIL